MEYKDSTGKIWIPNQNDTIQWRMTAYAAIVQDGKILLVKSDHATFFALPGGGVEKAESITEGLKRECKEEIGYEIEVIKEIGKVVEYREQMKTIYESYCYLVKTSGDRNDPCYDEHEKKRGLEDRWVKDIDTAIKLVENFKIEDYNGRFIATRDAFILHAAKEVM